MTRLSWLNSPIWPFSWVVVAWFLFQGKVMKGVFVACYPALEDWGARKVYECSSLDVVQYYAPLVPLSVVPFFWVMSHRRMVRVSALVAGLLGTVILLTPLATLLPYIDVGPVTYDIRSAGRSTVTYRDVERPIGNGGFLLVAAWATALLACGLTICIYAFCYVRDQMRILDRKQALVRASRASTAGNESAGDKQT